MVLFIKKRSGLPKPPSDSKPESYSLFVTPPEEVADASALAGDESVGTPSRRKGVAFDDSDVSDVEVVVATPSRPLADGIDKDEPQKAGAADSVTSRSPDTSIGLRVTRKAEKEAPATEASEKAVPKESSVPTPDAGRLSQFAKRFNKPNPSGNKAAPVEKDSERRSLFSRFASQRANLAGKRSAPATEEKPENQGIPLADNVRKVGFAFKDSLLSKLSPSSPSEASKPSRAEPKKAASSKAASSPKGAHLDFLVELDADRPVYWRVTSQGLTQVDADEVRKAASFSGRDNRYGAEVALSYNQARDLALSELGEECRIVNASKEHQAVYATTAARMGNFACHIGPGVALLEVLMSKGAHERKEVITGFLFSDETSSQSLAVLYYINQQGDFSAPQVTVNPDNLSFTLSQFASSKRVDVEQTEVLLFKNHEALSVAKLLSFYPSEAVWQGISVRKLAWLGVMVTMGAAGVSGLYATQAFVRMQMLEHEKSSLNAKVKTLDTALQKAISESLVTFALTQSVDVQQVTNRAADMWVPFSKVTLEATSGVQRYDVLLPLLRGSFSNNRPSVLGQLAVRDVEPLVGMEVPEGCSKDVPGVSGGVDAIQITITCENPVRPVTRYRID